MGSIVYMMRKTVKNAIIDTIRHPLRLLLYALLIGSMVYAVIVSFTGEVAEENVFSDKRILSGAYLAILYFISIPIMLKGLSTGTSFFSLSDVNFLFTSPVSDKKILIYGVGRQLASMLLLVFTFASYGGMVIKLFDVDLAYALVLVLGIMIMLLIIQLVTLLIFCISSGHPIRATIMKYIIYALPLFALGVLIVYMFSNGITLENFFTAISFPVLEYVPIVGWLHGLVFGIIDLDLFRIILFGSLLLVVVTASLVIFSVIKLDYYEDVIGRAESYFEWRDAMRSGRMSDGTLMSDKQLSTRKKGINHGTGALTIFFKHIREGSRRSRFMFFNINTVVLVLVAAVIGLGMKMAFSDMSPTLIIISAVVISTYIQFFFSAAGDWVKELSKPYIFLIPDDPVKKLIMAGATSIIKPYTDGVFAFVILGLIVGANPLDVISSVLVYGSFGSVYIAANILAQRIVGVDGNRGVFITFYMSFIVLLMIPGVLMGLFAVSRLGSLSFIAATVMGVPVIIWNIIASLLIFMLCRNLLNNIE